MSITIFFSLAENLFHFIFHMLFSQYTIKTETHYFYFTARELDTEGKIKQLAQVSVSGQLHSWAAGLLSILTCQLVTW